MFELKRRHYPLSYTLGITRILSQLVGPILLPVEFGVILLKSKMEGYRVNIFVYLFALIFGLLGFDNLSIITSIIFMYFARKLTNYELPNQGPPVGHIYCKGRWLEKFNKIPEIAIYYPADAEDIKNLKIGFPWLKVPNYANRVDDSSKKDVKRKRRVPLIFFQIVCTQFYKFFMYVYENAKIDVSKSKKFPVVILSPGLASHCDGYSVVARFLAQKGYIVFSPEHIEHIRNIYVDNELNRVYRQGQLKDRLATLKQVIDIVYDEALLRTIIPQDQNIVIDKSQISVLGHSFGGASAIQLSLEDKRITGCCIAYDPIIYVFPDTYEYPFTIPFMSINADDFYRRLYGFMQNDERLQKIFDGLSTPIYNKSISIYIKDQQHADFSDIPIIWNGESGLYSISKNVHEVHVRFGMILLITELFLKQKIATNDQIRDNQAVKDQILKEIEQNCGSDGKQILRWNTI